MSSSSLTLILAVPNLAEAAEFYQKLGFRETFSIPDRGWKDCPLRAGHFDERAHAGPAGRFPLRE